MMLQSSAVTHINWAIPSELVLGLMHFHTLEWSKHLTLFFTLNRILHALSPFPLVNRASDFVYSVHGSDLEHVSSVFTGLLIQIGAVCGFLGRRVGVWGGIRTANTDRTMVTQPCRPQDTSKKAFSDGGPFWKWNHCCYSWDTSVCNSHDWIHMWPLK